MLTFIYSFVNDYFQANYGPLGEYLFKGAVKTIPAGRLGNTNDDLAPSVLFMLSDGAKYTTGKNFSLKHFYLI